MGLYQTDKRFPALGMPNDSSGLVFRIWMKLVWLQKYWKRDPALQSYQLDAVPTIYLVPECGITSFWNLRKFSFGVESNWDVFRGEETWNYVIWVIADQSNEWTYFKIEKKIVRQNIVFILTHLKECRINKRLNFGLAQVCTANIYTWNSWRYNIDFNVKMVFIMMEAAQR